MPEISIKGNDRPGFLTGFEILSFFFSSGYPLLLERILFTDHHEVLYSFILHNKKITLKAKDRRDCFSKIGMGMYGS